VASTGWREMWLYRCVLQAATVGLIDAGGVPFCCGAVKERMAGVIIQRQQS
jgi:hypothetical protein